jgi:hypothetical protein
MTQISKHMTAGTSLPTIIAMPNASLDVAQKPASSSALANYKDILLR